MSKLSYIKCEQLDEALNNGDCTNKSYVAVKKCRMLRSGVQLYAHDEVPAELLKLLPEEKRNQAIYKVYRKPEAIVKHLNDFNYIAFVNTHPNEDVTPDNYKELSIGQVGGTAKLETLDDGNVYVDNEVVFTDRNAYQEYLDGKKEVSIGLNAMWRLADSGEYDFEVYDFENVNHLALVPRARAGKMAKIMDSNAVVDRLLNTCGGTKMKGFLKIFGIKKTNDTEVLLSAKVFDGINQITKEMKDEDVEKVVNPIMDCISNLGETEQKKVLVGIVTDALSDVEAVKGADEESKKKLADSIDNLFAKCKELDEETAQSIIADACGDKEAEKPAEDAKPEDKEAEKPAEDAKPEDKEAEKPAEDACGDSKDACGSSKDADAIAEIVNAAVAKALDSALESKIEGAVKKALHLEDATKPEAKGAVTDASVNLDMGDLLPNGWGC